MLVTLRLASVALLLALAACSSSPQSGGNDRGEPTPETTTAKEIRGEGVPLSPGLYTFTPFRPHVTFALGEGFEGGHTNPEFFDVIDGDGAALAFAHPSFVPRKNGDRLDVAEASPEEVLNALTEARGFEALQELRVTIGSQRVAAIEGVGRKDGASLFGGPGGEFGIVKGDRYRIAPIDVGGRSCWSCRWRPIRPTSWRSPQPSPYSPPSRSKRADRWNRVLDDAYRPRLHPAHATHPIRCHTPPLLSASSMSLEVVLMGLDLSPWKAELDPGLLDRIDAMAQELARQAADITAAEYRWLKLLAEFDDIGGWGVGGSRSCAAWLSWACGMSLPAARERVRVARALPALPLVSAAFAAGRMSYSKVRAVTRVATPANEETLVTYAENATAAQLETVIRGYRRSQRLEEGLVAHRQFERRSVRWWVDEEGYVRISARLPADDGALVVAQLERLAETGGEDEGDAAPPAPPTARRPRSAVRPI